jgi:hypothetical protein
MIAEFRDDDLGDERLGRGITSKRSETSAPIIVIGPQPRGHFFDIS